MRALVTMVALVASLLLPAAAPGQEPESEHEVSVEVVSRYLWRGYDLSHRDPALLATWDWSPEALGGIWTSLGVIAGLREDAAVGDDESELDEVDLTVGWESSRFAGGRLTLGAALYFYVYTSTWTKEVAYRDANDVEAEIYLSWRAGDHFRPRLEYYRGLNDEIRGDYLELGAAFPFGGEPWSTEPKVVAGWSDQFGVSEGAAHVTATLPVSWTRRGFTVTPSLSWTWVDDPEQFEPEDLVGGTPRDSMLWGSVELSWAF